MNNKKAISCIILAAGQGVRMNSVLPKVALPLCGVPLITRVTSTVSKLDCEKIVAVVGYKKDAVKKCLQDFPYLDFIDQKKQKGTGHAVMMTRDLFTNSDGYIIVIPGDVPLLTANTLRKLAQMHVESEASATVLTAILEDPAEYGRIVRNEEGYIERIVEFKDASDKERKIREINTGIICFNTRELFDALPQLTDNNAQKEYYLTDTLEILRKNGKKIAALSTENPIEIAGVNSKDQLYKLEQYVKSVGNIPS